ncbi:sodium/sugar symporter [Chitinophaga pinensis]|uniref:SSS sodium solute transporter superfamily n=1 Tax=Chitinophaga pinensis (strain ATCC 43595 / DSM 2588 / LMG 13176 / NBRC 15968 / NCIMB 11800 / UQM 2034) TaxID=485918 RepID=A0A979GWS2_CHIPD|nr:sodium/sugar symporter [Chitinophaga pinensis]ACU62164.1 SSS sodium solute transporter superfamily [Chitinophaga pinensis DSM 2588]
MNQSADTHHLGSLDYLVFFIYFIIVAGFGYYIFQRKRSKTASTKDFFLAEGSLTWWAIGASLIASNISAEHFIGQSGSGFALGLAISSYEWIAAATLIIVAIFFIPIYLKNKIYTMPQFLLERYNATVSTIMAIFWLVVYVLVNLTSIVYLGALAITAISGIPFFWCIIGLAIFALLVTLGGMKVIGYTDVIQVFVLIVGGLATTYLALQMVSNHFGYGDNILKGLAIVHERADTHFHMIFSSDHPYYKDLPGLSVIVGGMWINNLNYWGCNQYIIQRALGADLKTARNGILFAAFLKLLIPLIAVIPGITAYVLFKEGVFNDELRNAAGVVKPDLAYPTLMNLLPVGLKGLAFAALTAAIVASLAGKLNSISTIFSLDIYHRYFNKQASEKHLVRVGRVAVIVSMVIACIVAPALTTLDQAYQFIQDCVGYISPGILAIFLLGFFWRRTTSLAALLAAILTIPLSAILNFLPTWTKGAFPEYPFLDRMSIVFVFLVALMIIVTLLDKRSKDQKRIIVIDPALFRTTPVFIAGSVIITAILIVLYTVFW